MLTRRQFVAAGAGSWLCSGIPGAFARAPRPGAPGPRYFVTFFLRGGIDPVYTVDPKVRSEVEAKVDVPYGADQIVDTGGVPFGPHFKPLAKWANQMAIVRGVQVKTANHETGAFQIVRMRTGVTTNMPSLFDVIGQTRDTQPLASVLMGEVSSFEHSPGALAAPTGAPEGKTSLDAIDTLSSEDIDILARVYQRHLQRFPSWKNSAETDRTREYVSQMAAFFERMKTVKQFKAEEDWTKDKANKAGRAGEDMQRTLWFLENDLARGICVKIFFDWDSHFRNADKQQSSTANFTKLLDRFLTELQTRKNRFGTLAEQTVVVVGSELGRFPVMNGNLGKDHWPEAPYMFFGPNIRPGGYVQTGSFMEGTKTSLVTGKPDPAGANLVLDDVGTTLMNWAGLDPELYGYFGRHLKFLERT
ncbi:MAG: DUF1501 domain-containing protein [Deltaproteobacteria bacterium]|nr:DUF1501 domain-containing protein [Deltaproteobacteria bacterium]